MFRALLFALTLAFSMAADRAHANYRFGTEEEIRFIQDVALKGAQNEALYLGYMTRTRNFLLGYGVEDAGYVLGVKGESKRFYHMPKGDDLARFQKAGTLPDPLPPYQLGFFDYIVGYSLWWALALVAALWAVPAWRKRRNASGQGAESTPQA